MLSYLVFVTWMIELFVWMHEITSAMKGATESVTIFELFAIFVGIVFVVTSRSSSWHSSIFLADYKWNKQDPNA